MKKTHLALNGHTRTVPRVACGATIRPTGAPSSTDMPTLVTCRDCILVALRELLKTSNTSVRP